MKTATSLRSSRRRPHHLRDHRPRRVPDLQVAGGVLILTGVAGAIIPGSAAAGGTRRYPPPPRRVPGRQPAAPSDDMPTERETIEEYAGS